MRALTSTRDSQTISLRRVVAALCVFLILLVGVAQLLHNHPTADSTDAACSLCAVAHLAALPAAFAARPVVAEQLRPFQESAPTTGPPRFVVGSFTIRPPPASNPNA